METQEVKDLLAQFDQSSLTELSLRRDNFELYFNKNTMSGRSAATLAPTIEAPVTQVQPVAVQPMTETGTPEKTQVTAGTEIVSPLVGVVYLKPSPDKPAFKQIGDMVKKGEILCIVEAMKVMNEIVSDVDGEILEILVENEQTVEFNQPLFSVKEG